MNPTITGSAQGEPLTTEEQATLDSLTNPDQISETPKLPWNEDQVRMLVAHCINDPTFLEEVKAALKPAYFANYAHEALYTIALRFHEKYGTPPNVAILQEEFERVIADDKSRVYYLIEFKAIVNNFKAQLFERQYLLDEVFRFCRTQDVKDTFLAVGDILRKERDPEKAIAQLASLIDGPTQGIKLLSLSQSLARAQEQSSEWLIQDWLGQGRLHLMPGPAKAGKSTLVIQMIACLLTGKPFFKFPAKRCPVVLLDYENPADYVLLPLVETIKDLGGSIEDIEKHGLWAEPEKPPFPLTDGHLRTIIRKITSESGTGLIVVDTARSSQADVKEDWENKSSEVGKLLKSLHRVTRDTGWSILLLHHTNKLGQASGSTSWLGDVDFILPWKRSEGASYGVLEIQGRNRTVPPGMVIELHNGKLRSSGSLDEIKEKAQSNKSLDEAQELLPFLPIGAASATNANQINQLVDGQLSRNKVYKLLPILASRGLVEVTVSDDKARYFVAG